MTQTSTLIQTLYQIAAFVQRGGLSVSLFWIGA